MDRVGGDDFSRLVCRVHSALRTELTACGYGAIVRVERFLGVKDGYIRNNRNSIRLRANMLAAILEIMGIEPVAFFHRVCPGRLPPCPPRRPTRGAETLRRINEALRATFEERGLGAVRDTERALNLRAGYIRKNRIAGCLELGMLDAYLKNLRVQPARFFGRAFQTELEPPVGEADPVAAFGAAAGMLPRLRTALFLATTPTPTQADELTAAEEAELARLDALRYGNHRKARAEAERLCHTALDRGRLLLAIRAAGVAGSARRLALDLDGAQVLLWEAYRLADRCDFGHAAADLIQRMTYVMADRGRYEDALELADHALLRFETLRDEVGKGRVHVMRGTLLRKLGDWDEALEAFRVALVLLPDLELRYRATALHSSARIYVDRGDVQEATTCAKTISRLRLEGDFYEGRFSWLSAKLAVMCRNYDEAESHYLDTIFFFDHSSSPGDATFAALELVRLYLLKGRRYDAWAIARGMRARMLHLPKNDVLTSAAWELLRLERANELSLKLVDGLLDQIQVGRSLPSKAAHSDDS